MNDGKDAAVGLASNRGFQSWPQWLIIYLRSAFKGASTSFHQFYFPKLFVPFHITLLSITYAPNLEFGRIFPLSVRQSPPLLPLSRAPRPMDARGVQATCRRQAPRRQPVGLSTPLPSLSGNVRPSAQ